MRNHPYLHVHVRNSLSFNTDSKKLQDFVNSGSSHVFNKNGLFLLIFVLNKNKKESK